MATTRVFYKGKKELTMAQFEALASLDDAIDYDIIDFPNGGITNAQMTAALGYSRLFEDGDVFVCLDNGTYTKGNWYQIKVTNGVKSWEDITPASGDLQNYVPKQSEAEPVALTWTINRYPQVTTAFETAINFTSNGESFDKIQLGHGDPPYDFYSKITYVNSTASTDKVVFNGSNGWTSYGEAYRTLTFETEPSGELLAWLESNAVPQSEVDPNTALTWMFNETLINDNNGIEYDGNFVFETPDGNNWTYFSFVPSGGSLIVGSSEKSLTVYDTNGWISGVNRIITFETSAPTRSSWFTSNAVPQGSSTKTYAQVTNENGAVSIRVFENSDADLQNLSITKDGVTINGKKPLTSIQPLYKHELVIPYSFSVTDSETVNGSAIYHYLSNTGTQITSASEIDDNFLLSGAIGKNGSNTAASQSESTALTWIINEKPSIITTGSISGSTAFETPKFTIKGVTKDKLYGQSDNVFTILEYYYDQYLCAVVSQAEWGKEFTIYDYSSEQWANQDYRTLTFETAPTGELLTWLQANAVPQGGASPTTVLLLNINVIKAGSSITVEAVNASTMGYITGTAGTITDTVTQLI